MILFLTVARTDPAVNILGLFNRCGFKYPEVIRSRSRHRTFRVQAPKRGYDGCVRSLAFNLGLPVLVETFATEGIGYLLFPSRFHPADGAELTMPP